MTRWKTRTLGEVCSLVARGVAPSYLENGGTLVLNQKCVRDHAINYVLARRHNEQAKRVPHERLIRIGDVLINSTGTGTLGRVAQVRAEPPEPATVDTHVTIVRPQSGEFYADFFGYALMLLEDKLAASGEGTSGQTELARKTVSKFEISYPSDLQEQRRIVAVLDEAFAAIATAIANADKNLANARELPSAALTQFDLAGGNAELHRLGDLVTRLTNGYVGPTRNIYVDEGVPYLLARHVRDDVLTFDRRTHISPAFNAANKKSILVTGDVLLVQSGHIGHSAVVPPEHAGHNCHAMIVITPKPGLLGEYLSAYFNSIQGREATTRIRSGSTVPHLTCREVRELMIPVPSLEAQGALLEKYKAVQFSSKALADVYMRKLAALSELKQSLLHRAFSGKLTEREPLAA